MNTYTPTDLIAGEFPRAMKAGTVASAATTFDSGTVMGEITASGKLAPYDAGASDGTEEPIGILMEDVDATAGDVTSGIYETGEFREGALTGLDAAGKKKLRDRGIFVR
jgi:hypothetical protein